MVCKHNLILSFLLISVNILTIITFKEPINKFFINKTVKKYYLKYSILKYIY